nr:g-type lectin s-receptor-like serine/threonine-protein kinase [Quercus suber]
MRLLSRRNLLYVLCCFCLNLGVAIDTITSSQSIKDPGNIVSNGSAFKLGFFSPVNSTYRYMGIWYSNISVFTVIWVANRETPLNDSSGVLTISEDGNLEVLDGKKRDSLVIKCYKFCCQFECPTFGFGEPFTARKNYRDNHMGEFPTLLPKMKISTNVRIGSKVQLTSWQSPSDPSIGSFSVNNNF